MRGCKPHQSRALGSVDGTWALCCSMRVSALQAASRMPPAQKKKHERCPRLRSSGEASGAGSTAKKCLRRARRTRSICPVDGGREEHAPMYLHQGRVPAGSNARASLPARTASANSARQLKWTASPWYAAQRAAHRRPPRRRRWPRSACASVTVEIAGLPAPAPRPERRSCAALLERAADARSASASAAGSASPCASSHSPASRCPTPPVLLGQHRVGALAQQRVTGTASSLLAGEAALRPAHQHLARDQLGEPLAHLAWPGIAPPSSDSHARSPSTPRRRRWPRAAPAAPPPPAGPGAPRTIASTVSGSSSPLPSATARISSSR